MRFLRLVTGSVGDVHPHMGIGRALQNRGHNVTVMTLAHHRELVERAGLHAVTVETPEGTPTALANPKDAQQGAALKTLAAAFPILFSIRPGCFGTPSPVVIR